MRVVITLSDPGSQGNDFNLFNIYTDVDSYTTAVDTNISKSNLLLGYTCSNIPNDANIIRIISSDSPCMGVSQSINITSLFTGSRIYRNTSTNSRINAMLLIQTNGGEINNVDTNPYDIYFTNLPSQPSIGTLEYNTYSIDNTGLAAVNIIGTQINASINTIDWTISNISFAIKTNGIVVKYTYPGSITLTSSNIISNPVYLNMTRTQI